MSNVRSVLVFLLAACGSKDDGPLVPEGCEEGACSFCSADVWGGTAPGPTTDIVIPSGTTVVVDCDAEARSVKVEAGGVLFASRERSSTLTLHGNLHVLGTVDYGTPASRIPASVTAEIAFTGMRDEDFVGTQTQWDGVETSSSVDTAMKVEATDVGIWVMGSGTLAAAGVEKRAWSKLVAPAGPGDASFSVEDATGWIAGDRITLTPSAPLSAGREQGMTFHDATITRVDGATIEIDAAPTLRHDGCTDCMRRAEAANLTRNVVIRGADATAHAHVMIAERGIAQLDSVELRWLGPIQACSAEEGFARPFRRAPLWFHQQGDAAAESFVRHVAIWGAGQHFLVLEQSNGVEVIDVAGYDTHGFGFALFYDNTGCGTRCADRDKASSGTIFDHVLAAKVGVPERTEGCLRVGHRHAGFIVSGGDNSGAHDSVAVGVGWDGSGDDIAGFGWAEGGSGRPSQFTFTDNVAHNNGQHGALIWHNNDNQQPAYANNAMWSNGGYGVHWGAYQNAFVFTDSMFADNGLASVGAKAIPLDDTHRLTRTTVDDITILAYVFIQEKVATFDNVRFSGARPVGVTQLHDPCVGGNENDPADTDCLRVWLRFNNPVFPAGMTPFEFGQTFNKHSVWEIRGFSSPDYPALPANFDLYRPDNTVAGGLLLRTVRRLARPAAVAANKPQ